MFSASRSRTRYALRPSCDDLEARELLSATPKFHASVARVSALVSHFNSMSSSSIINRLPVTPDVTTSTVPTTGTGVGDQNPYGVATVPAGFPTDGVLQPGDVLVTNFNAASNLQGTGTTIVRVTPSGQQSVFFTSSLPGLSTALGVLKGGFVIVGNVPTTDGTFNTIGQGSLQIIDRFGQVVSTLTDPTLLADPWDLTINDHGRTAQVFVSNVSATAGNTGTITRLDLRVFPHFDAVQVTKMTQIATGYPVVPSDAAVVLGPTGLAYDPAKDVLYVASTGDNTIYGFHHASRLRSPVLGTTHVVYTDPAHLNGPLGLVLAPNGDLLTTNGDAFTASPPTTVIPSALIEFTPHGQFVGQLSLDPGAGAAFGLALSLSRNQLLVATANDVTASLDERFIPFVRRH